LLSRVLQLNTFSDRIFDLIKFFLITVFLTTTAKHITNLAINASYKSSLRFAYYRKYYNWMSLLERQLRMRWPHPSSRLLERKKVFKFFDPSAKSKDELVMRSKNKNFFVVTLKWSARNFHLNVCNTRYGGGFFKTSSGLLGAKKKNKRRFRYVRKALYYFLRFVLFYRSRQFRQQRKIFAEHYYTFLDLWNRSDNKNRFNYHRAILIDTRRWVRTAEQQILIHLIMEWFGREDKYDVFMRFVKRLKRIQYKRLKSKARRFKKNFKKKKKKTF